MRPGAVAALCILVVAALPLQGQEGLPDIPVTLPGKSRTVNQILEEISLQTGIHFTYDSELFDGTRRVKPEPGKQTIGEALDRLFGENRFDYRVIGRNIVIYRRNESRDSLSADSAVIRSLEGEVRDVRSGKSLPYATVSLFGSTLGTVTNSDGVFSFKVPAGTTDPLLVVSHIGYKRSFLPVQWPSEDPVLIELEEETIPLQEVIIRYVEPVSLLSEAIAKIPSNYLTVPSAMTAFYREAVQRNNHYMVYSEAVLDVSKGPYRLPSRADRVRIRQGRKVTDLSAEDTVIVKLSSGIHTSLNLDVIKNRPGFLAPDFLETYQVEYTDLAQTGDRMAYVISFRQREHIPDPLFRGKIFIERESLAIVAADFEYNPELIHKDPGLFLVSRTPHIRIRPILARYHVEYREAGEGYHVSQVRGEVEMRVRKKRQWFGSRYRISIELAVTDVVPGKQLRIEHSERVRPSQVLSDVPFEFDPEFWGPYNVIEPEASLRKALEGIEHNLQEITVQ